VTCGLMVSLKTTCGHRIKFERPSPYPPPKSKNRNGPSFPRSSILLVDIVRDALVDIVPEYC
jgi:hypothetical protein